MSVFGDFKEFKNFQSFPDVENNEEIMTFLKGLLVNNGFVWNGNEFIKIIYDPKCFDKSDFSYWWHEFKQRFFDDEMLLSFFRFLESKESFRSELIHILKYVSNQVPDSFHKYSKNITEFLSQRVNIYHDFDAVAKQLEADVFFILEDKIPSDFDGAIKALEDAKKGMPKSTIPSKFGIKTQASVFKLLLSEEKMLSTWLLPEGTECGHYICNSIGYPVRIEAITYTVYNPIYIKYEQYIQKVAIL